MTKKNIRIKPCPVCGEKKPEIWLSYNGTRLVKWRYFVMCPSCRWYGYKKLFKRRAVRSWNRYEGWYKDETK